MKFVSEAPVGVCLLHRIEIFALQIFDERRSQH